MADGGESASERHKVLKTSRAALADAVRDEQIGHNVAWKGPLPKVDFREMQYLNAEQAKAFLAGAQADRLAAMYDLAMDAGLRPAELVALRWSDISFQAGTVLVHRSLENLKGFRLKKPKTRKGKRLICAAKRTLKALEAHRGRMLAEGRDMERGIVFCNAVGGFLRILDRRRNWFLPILKRAGLPTIQLYHLRHTSATLLLSQDVNVRVVSE
jgi:integrase